MEVSDFLLTFFVWGMVMLRVIFNIEAGNYYSKSTFIIYHTVIKQEKLRIGNFMHSGVFMRFYKIVYGYPGI